MVGPLIQTETGACLNSCPVNPPVTATSLENPAFTGISHPGSSHVTARRGSPNAGLPVRRHIPFRPFSGAFTSVQTALYFCKSRLYSCKSRSYLSQIGLYLCKRPPYSCQTPRESCKTALYSCKHSLYPFQTGLYSCQEARARVQTGLGRRQCGPEPRTLFKSRATARSTKQTGRLHHFPESRMSETEIQRTSARSGSERRRGFP